MRKDGMMRRWQAKWIFGLLTDRRCVREIHSDFLVCSSITEAYDYVGRLHVHKRTLLKTAKAVIEATKIFRYENHHVLLDEVGATIEHPPTCDLNRCDLLQRCWDTWLEPPAKFGAKFGWWRLNDDLSLTEPEERIAYWLVQV